MPETLGSAAFAPTNRNSHRHCHRHLHRQPPMLLQVIVSDKWKDGANNTLEGGGKKVNENKALSKKKQWQPYSAKCTVGLPVLLPSHFRISCDRIPCTLLAQTCKTSITKDYKYCQPCSYRKGLCAICGKQVGGENIGRSVSTSMSPCIDAFNDPFPDFFAADSRHQGVQAVGHISRQARNA